MSRALEDGDSIDFNQERFQRKRFHLDDGCRGQVAREELTYHSGVKLQCFHVPQIAGYPHNVRHASTRICDNTADIFERLSDLCLQTLHNLAALIHACLAGHEEKVLAMMDTDGLRKVVRRRIPNTSGFQSFNSHVSLPLLLHRSALLACGSAGPPPFQLATKDFHKSLYVFIRVVVVKGYPNAPDAGRVSK